MELAIGLEPTTCWLQISCSTNWATPAHLFGAGNGSRTRNLQLGRLSLYQMSYFRFFFEWERKDSNLRRLRQQIYSLPHLAALELSQKKRAGRRIRTADQLITNQLLWPTELHRLFLVYFQSTFSLLMDCKNTTFFFTKIKNIHFFIFFYNYQKIK